MRKMSIGIAAAWTCLYLGASTLSAGTSEVWTAQAGAATGTSSQAPFASKDTAGYDVVAVGREFAEGALSDRTDICGALGPDEKCRTRPASVDPEAQHARYVGACLPYPVLGRLFCWR